MIVAKKINRILSITILTVIFAFLSYPKAYADIAEPPEMILAGIGFYFWILLIVVYVGVSVLQIIIQFILNVLEGQNIKISLVFTHIITFFIVFTTVLFALLNIHYDYAATITLEVMSLFFFGIVFYKAVIRENRAFNRKETYIAIATFLLMISLPIPLLKMHEDYLEEKLAYRYFSTCNALIDGDWGSYITNSVKERLAKCENQLKKIDLEGNLKTIYIMQKDYNSILGIIVYLLPDYNHFLIFIPTITKSDIKENIFYFNAERGTIIKLHPPAANLFCMDNFSLHANKYLVSNNGAIKDTWYEYNQDTNKFELLDPAISKALESFDQRYYRNTFLSFPGLRFIGLVNEQYIQYFDLLSGKKYKPVKINESKENIIGVKQPNDQYLIPGLTSKTVLDLYDVKTNSIKPFVKLKYPVNNIKIMKDGNIFMVLNQNSDYVAILNPKTKKVTYKKSDIPVNKFLYFNDGRVLLVSESELYIYSPETNKIQQIQQSFKKIKSIGIAPDTGNILVVDDKLNVINPNTGVNKTFANSSFLYDIVEMFPASKNRILLGHRRMDRYSKFYNGFYALPKDENFLILEYKLD